ncbi:DNA-binding response regulator [Sphaerisporangium melleum]|uniref:DNA-binding response regulator n=1 Tax=Sphaerisporangium melleum TaxID=321316 RepID=A0A917QVW4_9ACTN|nr:response regulator transcription factor [Sphaerisporangium melleum]GGK70157.1 DNA-binding response regulator [Sphaerisporangium melleum]GII70317.1 DNA-binding response regulator [Sphaerisporangium melleum]
MRLIIADDSLLVREGLARVLTALGHEVVAAACRAEQVLGLVARHRPDLVILDVRLPPTLTDEGLRLAAAIQRRHAGVPVLILSHYVESSYVTALLDSARAGVGYLLKDRVTDPDMLDEVLAHLRRGGNAVDPEVVAHLLAAPRPADPLLLLSEREREVLALMAQGLSDRGIAERLTVAVTTVGTHIRSIFHKLGLVEEPSSNRRVTAVLTYLTGRDG